MTAQELILKGIIDEASIKAEEILNNAKAEADSILEAAKSEAKAYSGEMVASALKRASTIKSNAESASALILRDARLKRKIREIDGVISAAIDEICRLSDEKYFELIVAMAAKIAESKPGEIFLSKDDLEKRKTDYLLKGIKEQGLTLTLSDKAADIKSGFVIKYGDIEINSSFEAKAAEKRGELEDTVNAVLFTE